MKPGYRPTEIGLIPEDWEITTVGKIARFSSGRGISVSRLQDYSSDFPVPVFGGNGVAGYTTTAIAQERTVVIGRVGQRCGEVYLTDGAAWISDNALYPIQMLRGCDIGFFALTLQASGLNSVKNRNDLPLITQSILHSVKIGWPPKLAEQAAIASTVKDVETLLDGLDRLIAKKRDLKLAAMQQLLTGQIRLPDFHGEWEVKRLGIIVKVRHGKSQHGVVVPDGEFPILASGGEIGRTNTPLYDKPSVLIGRKGTIDSPQYAASPFWTVDTLFFTEISDSADAKFVFFKFTMIPWRRYNEASGVPSLNAKTIENIEIRLPHTKTEQAAIAQVLTEMDSELAALERRREKTRDLKQAMMQELLTGKTRLV